MAPIVSVPATFTVGIGGAVTATFPIPAGTYVSGTWALNNALWSIHNLGGGNAITISSGGNVGCGSHLNGSARYTDTATVSAAQLANINTNAGGTVNASLSLGSGPGTDTVSIDSSASFTLTLVGTSTGGGPTGYTGSVVVGFTSNALGQCLDTITIQLTDSSGNAANAPAGGQQFTLSDGLNGQFGAAMPMTIPAGSSSITVTYTNPEAGVYPVTITPGTGPLSGVAAQTVQCQVTCSPTTPNPVLCAITRGDYRDAIRRKIGIVPPIDAGLGPSGALPLGQSYPDNAVLNQCIADAIRTINRRCRLHETNGITVSLSAQTANGPLVQPLTGLIGCATQTSINTVQRLIFTDSAGNVTRLAATNFFEEDRRRYLFDTLAPGTPQFYFIQGYQLFIYPAPSLAGTLTIWAGTAITQMSDDVSVIDQLPSDYLQAVEDWGALFVCMYMPTSPRPPLPGLLQRLPLWKEMAEKEIAEILEWHNGLMEEEYQPTLAAAIGRRRRIR